MWTEKKQKVGELSRGSSAAQFSSEQKVELLKQFREAVKSRIPEGQDAKYAAEKFDKDSDGVIDEFEFCSITQAICEKSQEECKVAYAEIPKRTKDKLTRGELEDWLNGPRML
eukprot:SAG11_NODE_2762_length_3000_cov_3.166494_3_plen_113_part_00